MITTDKALAIAASAYNVCGPRTGEYARPATVAGFDRPTVLHCLAAYLTAHDGEMFTVAEIAAAAELLAA